MLIVASEPIIPTETWSAINDRTLLRAHRKLLLFSNNNNANDDDSKSIAQSTPDAMSERELPFTD